MNEYDLLFDRAVMQMFTEGGRGRYGRQSTDPTSAIDNMIASFKKGSWGSIESIRNPLLSELAVDPVYQTMKEASQCGGDEILSVSWTVGGQEGGSCWSNGDNVHRAVSAESEPAMTNLDSLIESVCPDMKFLVYKRICNTAVKTFDYSVNEYYGNYTEYRKKYVVLSELYAMMKNEGCFG